MVVVSKFAVSIILIFVWKERGRDPELILLTNTKRFNFQVDTHWGGGNLGISYLTHISSVHAALYGLGILSPSSSLLMRVSGSVPG